MKRKLLVLLALGLVMAFSSSALAADVMFSGSFFAVGMYQDKTSFIKDDEDNSTAFYYQRLRVLAEVVVSPGLSLITRFDVMERAWGAPRASATGLSSLIGDFDSAGSRAENENIAFDWAYIRYASPIGVFTVGYQEDMAWGTKFADYSRPAGKIAWAYTVGGVTLMADVAKILELSSTAKLPTPWTDADIDKYSVAAKYTWKGGEAGMKVFYLRNAATRGIADFKSEIYGVIPYAIAKFGPITVEAEVDYYWGNLVHGDTTGYKVKLDSLGIYIDALADLGMFYAGGTFAYLSGDKNFLDDDKIQFMAGGKDWMPCLIMFNFDRTYWAGPIDGIIPDFGIMYNAWFYQVRGGVRPVPDLDLGVSLSYAYADKRIYSMPEKDYGWELDVTANYKITNNLSYMLGVGYLWAGDYYKQDAGFKLNDNYLVINKLTLTF
jgi:hypothetical protein